MLHYPHGTPTFITEALGLVGDVQLLKLPFTDKRMANTKYYVTLVFFG